MVQPVAGTVVRPIGDLVETVTGGLAAAPPDALPSLPGFPSLPSLPSLPSSPSLPGVGDQSLPAGPVPQQSGGAKAAVAGRGTGQRSVAGPKAAYGPLGDVGADAGGVVAHRGGLGVHAGEAPARQAPPGEPTGTLDHQSAVDNGAPRHGDPHAVTPIHRASLRLAPGATAVVTAVETRDRHRDIPVFPG